MPDVRATQRETKGPGVPRLLEHLAAMSGETVYLWLNPDRGETCWFVWTGHPTGSGGAEWGRGTTAYEALQDAFRRLTDAIFEGRIVDRPKVVAVIEDVVPATVSAPEIVQKIAIFDRLPDHPDTGDICGVASEPGVLYVCRGSRGWETVGDPPFVGPKHCDHRDDRLGSTIGPNCLCDRTDCRQPAVRFGSGGFHFCEEHADA